MDKLLDLTRDFDAAKAAFEAYLDEYDRADDKIHLKIVHTYGVVDAAEDIARRMRLGAAQRHVCHSIYLLGPGRKAGGRFGKRREAGSGAV